MLFDDEEDFMDLVPAGAKPSAGSMIGYIPARLKPGQSVDLERDRVGLRRDEIGVQRDQSAQSLDAIKLQREQLELERLRMAPEKKVRALPENIRTRIETQVSAATAFDNSANNFRDDYAGAGSGWENTFQNYVGTGTPGQRDWWAEFKSNDAQLRNELFGASLTPGESASWESTTISENMTPAEVRRNIERRQKLTREVLDRRARSVLAGPYDPDEITPLLGDYDPTNAGTPINSTAQAQAGAAGTEAPRKPGEALVEVAFPDETQAAYADADAGEYARLKAAGLDPVEVQEIMERRRVKRGEPPTPIAPIDNGDGAFGAAARGVGDTVTFGSLDEIGGFADTAGQLLSGDMQGSFGEAMSRNIDRNRAVVAGDEQRNPGARMAGQFAGALVPFGAFSGAVTAGRVARVGAVQGGAYGFGSAEGDAVDRVPNALLGATAGAAGGYAIGRAVQAAPNVFNALGKRVFGPGTAEQRALIEAGERRQVRLNASDVAPGVRSTVGFLESSPGSAGVIQRAIAGGRDDIEREALRGAGGVAPLSNAATGERVSAAGDRLISDSGKMVDQAYSRARTLAPDTTTVKPQSALTELDGLIERLGRMSGTNAPKLNVLNRIRGDLVETISGPNGSSEIMRDLNIDDVRGLRRTIREALDADGLTMSLKDSELQGVVRAASDDMFRTLQGVSPQAAQAWKQADKMHMQRMEYIEDVLQPVLGKTSDRNGGEAVFSKMVSMMSDAGRGDSRTLNRLMRSLNQEERLMVNSRIIHSAGRVSPDEPFSPARFITSVRNIGPRARITMFGREGARAIDDLILLSEAKKGTVGALNNSRSGQVANYRQMLSTAVFGGGAGAVAGVPGIVTAGGLMAAGNMAARVVTSPKFARVLAGAPNTANPAAINAHIARLRRIATNDPNLRGVVEGLQRNMLQLVSTPSTRIAAEDRDQQRPPRP